MTYGDFKVLTRRAAFDIILCNKTFNNAKNSKYDGYQRAVASMVYNFFDKRLLLVVLQIKIFRTNVLWN